MSNSLRFYTDSGMTVQFSLLSAVQTDDGAASAVDSVSYIGSPVTGMKFRDTTSPGTAQIVLSIVDSMTGMQIPASSVRLALSSGALPGATPGASLNLGTQILSGSGNALPVYARIDSAAIAAGTYNNLSLVTSSTIEEPV